MFPDRSSTNVDYFKPRTLRTALRNLTVGMRELEEQLPLPADRRVRDNTAALQKAAALRVDLAELNLRLTQISQQFQTVSREKE